MTVMDSRSTEKHLLKQKVWKRNKKTGKKECVRCIAPLNFYKTP